MITCPKRRKNGRCGAGTCTCQYYGVYGLCKRPVPKQLPKSWVEQSRKQRLDNPEFQIRSMPKGYGPHRDGRILR